MKKRIIAMVLCLVCIISSLTGCGSKGKSNSGSKSQENGSTAVKAAEKSDTEGTTITFWHSMGGVNGDAINALIKKFNEENKSGITVKAEYQGTYDDAINK
ncbi:glycerol-3-phosphate ABC transporter, periplasmic glycerol-3-phosphate-binding protein [Lachnospiraceae bacterium KM106-2]|nr:glycerol-3-phosphate ABC transporter, periplasmic glycerol-3-phosphate-binding protein [Lachnospiraceae bacterium KM106-2]